MDKRFMHLGIAMSRTPKGEKAAVLCEVVMRAEPSQEGLRRGKTVSTFQRFGDREIAGIEVHDIEDHKTPKPKLSRGSSRLNAEDHEAKEKDLWIRFLAEIPAGNRKSRFDS
jgi:hypothetical protein